MKHLRPFNVLLIVALLLAGLTIPAFGQGPSPQGEPPTATPEPPPPPTKEPQPASLDTASSPAEPAKPAGWGGGIESLSGSNVQFDNGSQGYDTYYVPGASQTFCFLAESYTSDWEWVYDLWVRFPSNWQVTNVWDDGPNFCDQGGNWGTFDWSYHAGNLYEIDIDQSRYHANPNDHCYTYYCFEVTSGTGALDALESWYWDGDGYGSAPHHPCSDDNYTPSGMPACDEAINPQATIPPCQPDLYLSPDTLEVGGCNGVTQTHTFNLYNNTGSNGTFNLTYDVPSGNGILGGPASLTLNDGESQAFDVELTPDLCLPEGTEVIATMEVSGNSYDDTSVITKTVFTGILPEWQSAAPTSQGTRYHAVAYHDGYLYQIGGETDWWIPTNAVYQYDIASDTWSAVTSLPTARYGIDAVTMGDNIYVPGGSDDTDDTGDGGTFLDDLLVYSTTGSTWSMAATMPVALAYASAVAYDGQLYVIGGENNTGTYVDTLYIYDPATNSWSQGASMNEARGYAAAAAIGDKIYVAGGFAGGTTVRNSLEIYDPATDSWSFGPALPFPWAPFGDGVKHDYLIIFSGGDIDQTGGSTGYQCSTNAWAFDTVTNQWHAFPDLNRCLYGSQGDGDGSEFYLVSGRTNEGGWHMALEVEYLKQCPPCEEQGWLEGYVMDSELGGTEPPCTEAVVHIEPGDLDVPADPVTGYYGPVQLISYTYTLEASAPGFSVETAVVDVTTDVTTTQDFNLWRPVIDVEPTDFISITALISEPVTYTLSISNNGHLPLDFEIREIPSSLLFGLAEPRSYQQMPAAVGVDSFIYEQFAASPDGGADFFIAFKDTAGLMPAYHMNWSDRGRFVVKALQAAADAAQGQVKAWLDERGVEYTSYWINNTLFVHANEATMNALAAFPEVSGFMGNHIYQVMPMEGEEEPQGETLTPQYPWNIHFPGADQVHVDFGLRGEGIVIGGMDTGVDYDHIGLVNNYRGNLGGGSFDHTYSWFDPYADDSPPGGCFPSTDPCDTDGHGTATHGIMAGDDDPSLPNGAWIGMAPNAQWIHCLGLDGGSGDDAYLNECAQWFLAPGGDSDMRPHVVNHSWGSWTPDDCDGNWYAPALQAYRAADIFPAFAAGNVGDWVSPPHCWSSTSPANNTDAAGNPLAFASGAHGDDGSLDYYSSGGPSACNSANLFPDLVAPGLGSCTTGLNDTYNCSFGGTSSASPHTAGCVALVRQMAPWLTVEQVEQVLRDAADDVDDGCGEPGESPDWNNKYGEGHLDCYEAVELTLQYDFPWVWEDPISGTIPGPGMIEISATFHCTETRDYTGTLRILHNDPCEAPVDVPIALHCQAPPPEPAWDKQVSVNDVPTDTTPITVVPSDTVEIVDRVWITYTAGVTFTLVETWTESLDLDGWEYDAGSAMGGANTLTWDVTNAAPNTWYAITKTFHVLPGIWDTDTITESLWVEYADPQPDDRVLQFNYPGPDIKVDPLSLSATLNSGDTATRTLTISNVGTVDLIWNLVENPPVSWLSEAPTNDTVAPSDSTDVLVTFDASGLTDDIYTTTLQINSDDLDEPQVDVSVVLTVTIEAGAKVYLPIIMKNATP